MRRFHPSPKAAKQIDDLDEKLQCCLITPYQYDRAYANIIAADGAFKQRVHRRRLLKKTSAERRRLRVLFKQRKISAEELRLRLINLEKQSRKFVKRKKRIKLASANTLRSGMGKFVPAFKKPHISFRSPRIRGVTARLAKKSDTAMVSAIREKEKLTRRPTALQREKVL